MIERGIGAVAEVCCNHFAFYQAVGRGITNSDGEVEVLNQLSSRKSNYPRAFILYDFPAKKGTTILQTTNNQRTFNSTKLPVKLEFKKRSASYLPNGL
ncbi:hypothetical protein TNCT_371971 [Trichonephila clavata]|uniref:Uncharacterized protein n=1 Tax=Trichonephila clavata TaxID=2740835 RepID=A0A8X6L155_TRICU|nr:hypothetical protein TNCT_371971 [Trichonephila clavata]